MIDLIYAIGDIHGRMDLFNEMEKRIAVLSKHIPANEPTVVTIGDYCDKGPDTKSVLETMMKGGFAGMQLFPVVGNHDAWLTRAIEAYKRNESSWQNSWLSPDVMQTLKSFGCVKTDDISKPKNTAELNRMMGNFVRATEKNIIPFIKSLSPIIIDCGTIFVHAGLNPNFHLNEQDFDDCINGVDGFLTCTEDFGYPVCVGHTVFTTPYISRNHRIFGIDTGGAEYGTLTCAIFNQGKLAQFICACPPDGLDWTPVFVDENNDAYLSLTRMWFRDIAMASRTPPICVFPDDKRFHKFIEQTKISGAIRVKSIAESKTKQKPGIKYRVLPISSPKPKR